MGYMDIDKVRYYDIREVQKVFYPLKAIDGKTLASDSTKRVDSLTLQTGDFDKA